MSRVVLLGTGTGVGKTYVTAAAAAELRSTGVSVLALKPLETGASDPGSDAAILERAMGLRIPQHPLYSLRQAVSPHLAAAREHKHIELRAIADWVESAEHTHLAEPNSDTLHCTTGVCLIETAGGALSPLTPTATNFDLARLLEPATWVLVAPDRLGVLHDLRATLEAFTARGRPPDYVVLSAQAPPDASSGSNAAQLPLLGLPRAVAVLRRGCPQDIKPLVAALELGGA